MPRGRTPVAKSSQARVFTIEDRAGPSHTPVYQTLTRATAPSWAQGDITPVRVADPDKYGGFLTVDKIKGQAGLPTLSLEARTTMQLSQYLKLARKRCSLDVQIHHGVCKDPTDFDLGWEKIDVFEDADFTNFSETDLGAFDADQEAPVNEMVDITAIDWYQLKPLNFTAIGESQIVQEVIDITICDSRSCGACGVPSDGCQRIFAVQNSAGASPGLPSEVISSQDGGETWEEQVITTLPANFSASSIACVSPYLAVVSNGDDSLHYASLKDLIEDVATWTEVTSGFVGAGSPRTIRSMGRTKSWIVGDGGYIYFSEDITAGVEVQSAGTVTVQDLRALHPLDENNVLAGGAAGALVVTKNGGITWAAVTGPSAQAAVAVTAVWMLSENEWLAGYADGELWYTIDGGVNWLQRGVPGSLTSISSMVFSTRTVGYLSGSTAGLAAKLLRTVSGGRTWYVAPEMQGGFFPTASTINAIAACGDDPNVVYAGGLKVAGGDGIIIKGA